MLTSSGNPPSDEAPPARKTGTTDPMTTAAGEVKAVMAETVVDLPVTDMKIVTYTGEDGVGG